MVDAEPFRAWVKRKMTAYMRNGYSWHEAEYRLGLARDKKIPARISFEQVDRVLQFEATTHPRELYPEVYEAIT